MMIGDVAAVGGGTTAINAYNNFTGNNFLTNNNPERTKNNWSGALDVLETGAAVMPFASRDGRNAMFGAEARARTLATGKAAWNGAGNLASRTVNGIGNMANRTVSGAKNGLLNAEVKVNDAMDESPVLDWLFPRGGNGPQPALSNTVDEIPWLNRMVPNGGDAPEMTRPMRMDIDGPEGRAVKVPGSTLNEPTPRVPTSETTPEVPVTEPDVGLSNRGYRPEPGERSMTREQWKAESSERRARSIVSRTDQPLENPRANAAHEGHGHSDHGYRTTDTQHGNRIRTRITPSGRVGKPVSKSSKFNSPQSEAEAVGRGRVMLEKDLANRNVIDTYPDPITGRPTYVDPATGSPTRHTISVTSDRPHGFGYKIVKQKDAAGNVLKDTSNQPLTVADPTPIRNATVTWEYVPSKGEWHIVTHYPN
jgi:hypothetical protein